PRNSRHGGGHGACMQRHEADGTPCGLAMMIRDIDEGDDQRRLVRQAQEPREHGLRPSVRRVVGNDMHYHPTDSSRPLFLLTPQASISGKKLVFDANGSNFSTKI